jgi:hypothetical protein
MLEGQQPQEGLLKDSMLWMYHLWMYLMLMHLLWMLQHPASRRKHCCVCKRCTAATNIDVRPDCSAN